MMDKKPLSAEIENYLQKLNEMMPKMRDSGFFPSAKSSRQALAFMTSSFVTDIYTMEKVRDCIVVRQGFPDVKVRIYQPRTDKALPILLFFHGGGGVAGSVDVYDPIARRIAHFCQQIVVSVDYRLAPENPYPAGVEDGMTVLLGVQQLFEQQSIPYSDINIAGDSAGGGIGAILLSRLPRDTPIKIKSQVLIYPCMDYSMSLPSIEENAEGFLLEKSGMAWYFEQYLQNNENRHQISPLFATTSHEYPRTWVCVCDYCPLRDEGIAYYQKLTDLGVETELYRLTDVVHSFLNLENLCKTQCLQTYQNLAQFLNRN